VTIIPFFQSSQYGQMTCYHSLGAPIGGVQDLEI